MAKLQLPDIAHALEELATLIELDGENVFAVRAHQRAAEMVREFRGSVDEFVMKANAGEVKGIGASLREKIQTLAQTGSHKTLNELRKKFPPSYLELLKVPGLGAKKLAILREELDVNSITDLEKVCKSGSAAALKGFGKKTAEKILKGLEDLESYSDQFLFSKAWEESQILLKSLKANKACLHAEVGGSLRRRKEIIKDIDIVVSSKAPEKIMEAVEALPGIARITAKGSTKASLILKSGIPVDVRVVAENEFPCALQYFTGNKEHNTELRGRAQKKGLKLNEYGLFKGKQALPIKNEEELYRHLDLAFVPPEARESRNEFKLAEKGKYPKLVEASDIKGILHAHSDYSDGAASLKSMAMAVRDRGYEYLGITDHSRSSSYAGGLTIERLKVQFDEIDRLNEEMAPFVIFKGTECDILKDGSLDYPDEVLKQLDFFVISVHSRFGMEKKEMTDRIIRAVSHPYTTILGHMTGRLLLERQGYQVETERILEAAAKHNVAVEINCNPHRLDIDWRHVEYAKSLGLSLPINPDAHSFQDLDNIFYGIGIARKGNLEKQDVLNTKSAKEIASFFRKKIKH